MILVHINNPADQSYIVEKSNTTSVSLKNIPYSCNTLESELSRSYYYIAIIASRCMLIKQNGNGLMLTEYMERNLLSRFSYNKIFETSIFWAP